ncbi:MAG: ADP-ribosylglycohydrolase family protein [Chloroflexota bacterium]
MMWKLAIRSWILPCLPLFFLVGCRGEEVVVSPVAGRNGRFLSHDTYYDKLYGAWQATMVANHTGLDFQGIYLDEPGAGDSIELLLLDEWSTDDDTHVEWVDLHILETHGLEPSYEQIRDEWVDHLNNDIWVSALRARQLMDEGIVPPQTSDPALNPEGVWSIGAQLQTELFGLIAPELPDEAMRRARRFARVTNSGLAVEASAFYAHMYANAFFESDVPTLINLAKADFAPDSQIYAIVYNVQQWHRASPNDWRQTRQQIRDAYDDDPMWWASKVNFATTIMALLYGEGDMIDTLTIAALAGWDADNNMTTAVGLLGIISGYDNLPDPIRTSTDIYFNQDVTGDLPQYDSVSNIARRTQMLGELAVQQAGGTISTTGIQIP